MRERNLAGDRMPISKGDFIRISYIGRIKESGKVFDTNIESVAKEHGLYKENVKFKPQPVVVGARHVIKGLDEALEGCEVGETKKVVIPPEKAFGLRRDDLIKVIPLREFRKNKINPVPGMVVEIDGKPAKVLSVSGGRVRVDFNSELAGKEVEYEFKVEEKINKTEEKIRLLLELYMPFADPSMHDIKIDDSKAVITLADVTKFVKETQDLKLLVARDIFRYIEGIKEVHFVDVYKKKEEKKEEEVKEEKKVEEKEKKE